MSTNDFGKQLSVNLFGTEGEIITINLPPRLQRLVTSEEQLDNLNGKFKTLIFEGRRNNHAVFKFL